MFVMGDAGILEQDLSSRETSRCVPAIDPLCGSVRLMSQLRPIRGRKKLLSTNVNAASERMNSNRRPATTHDDAKRPGQSLTNATVMRLS